MTIPYTNHVEVTIEDGSKTCVTLPAPKRGTLRRLVVKQTSGTTSGFTFNLFDRKDACAGETEDTSNPTDGVELLDPDLHKLQDTQSPAGAASLQFGLSLSYVNQDEQDPYRRLPTGAIYMELDPVSGSSADFSIAYTVDAPDVG